MFKQRLVPFQTSKARRVPECRLIGVIYMIRNEEKQGITRYGCAQRLVERRTMSTPEEVHHRWVLLEDAGSCGLRAHLSPGHEVTRLGRKRSPNDRATVAAARIRKVKATQRPQSRGTCSTQAQDMMC